MPSKRPPAPRAAPRRNDTMEVQADWLISDERSESRGEAGGRARNLIESEPPPSKKSGPKAQTKRSVRPAQSKPGPGVSIAPPTPTMPRITAAPERRNTMEVEMSWLEFDDAPPPAKRQRKPWEPPTLPPPPATAARARRVIPPPLPREEDDEPPARAPRRASKPPARSSTRPKASTRPPRRR